MKKNIFYNIYFLLQPHFKTNSFRVACNRQQGLNENYIVVTCSPEFNGVWAYPACNVSKYETIYSGSVLCYVVPIEDCIKIKELNEITNKEIIKKIKSYQNKWITGKIKNNVHKYDKKPDWVL